MQNLHISSEFFVQIMKKILKILKFRKYFRVDSRKRPFYPQRILSKILEKLGSISKIRHQAKRIVTKFHTHFTANAGFQMRNFQGVSQSVNTCQDM